MLSPAVLLFPLKLLACAAVNAIFLSDTVTVSGTALNLCCKVISGFRGSAFTSNLIQVSSTSLQYSLPAVNCLESSSLSVEEP